MSDRMSDLADGVTMMVRPVLEGLDAPAVEWQQQTVRVKPAAGGYGIDLVGKATWKMPGTIKDRWVIVQWEIVWEVDGGRASQVIEAGTQTPVTGGDEVIMSPSG